MNSREVRRRNALENVGKRCHWKDEGYGTITGVMIGGGGWPVYMIRWDDDTPVWWSNIISCSHGDDFQIDEP